MFDEKRREVATVYLSCLVATFVVIFIPLPNVLKLVLLLLLTLTQFCASTWYSLSYIPMGRRTALRILQRMMGIEETSSYSNIFGGSGGATV